MSNLQSAPEESAQTSLGKGRLGVFGIVFFVVAAAAPLVGMTGAVPVAIVLGNGAAVPGTYLMVGIILLLFSVGYATMSHYVTNTGAFFAFIGRGLGVAIGVGSAFVSLIAYLAIQLAIFGFFGVVMAGEMNNWFGVDLAWWIWVLIAWALVFALSWFSVDIGAKFLGVLLILELASLALVGLAVVFSGGGSEGLQLGDSFAPAAIFAGAPGIAFAFAFASFIGFEATAIYGEEAKNPKKTVPRATYLAVLIITILFALVSWAMVSGIGSSVIVEETLALTGELGDPAQLLFAVADQYVGTWLSDVMSVLVVTSLFAGLLAFQNSAGRYFFSMGRSGVLPTGLDRVNKFRAPAAGSIATSVVTGIVILWFAIANLDPFLNLFSWFSGLAVVAIVLVELLVCLAVVAYFRRTRVDTRTWNTLIAPLLAFVGLLVGEYLLIAKFALLAGTAAEGSDPTVDSFALNTTGWILVLLPFVVLILGSIWGTVHKSRENEDLIKDLVS
jgi:amino acid transporter